MRAVNVWKIERNGGLVKKWPTLKSLDESKGKEDSFCLS